MACVFHCLLPLQYICCWQTRQAQRRSLVEEEGWCGKPSSPLNSGVCLGSMLLRQQHAFHHSAKGDLDTVGAQPSHDNPAQELRMEEHSFSWVLRETTLHQLRGAIFNLFLSGHADKLLKLSRHTVSFLTADKTHCTARVGLISAMDPTNKWPFPKLLQQTCGPFLAHWLKIAVLELYCLLLFFPHTHFSSSTSPSAYHVLVRVFNKFAISWNPSDVNYLISNCPPMCLSILFVLVLMIFIWLFSMISMFHKACILLPARTLIHLELVRLGRVCLPVYFI